MKTSLAVLLTGALVGLSGASVQDPVVQPAYLVGQVTDGATDEPLESVVVAVLGQGIGSMTNREGLFRIVSVENMGPIELSLNHRCYHSVRVEIDWNPRVNSRRIHIGMPYDYEKHEGFALPLGGCPRR